jgi:predicted unusual protein kinase regulating ubiquinone biosynthesis (AarF/ABC1/UbiB family)
MRDYKNPKQFTINQNNEQLMQVMLEMENKSENNALQVFAVRMHSIISQAIMKRTSEDTNLEKTSRVFMYVISISHKNKLTKIDNT